MRRAVLAGLAVVVGVALLIGLHPISPARTIDDYEHKAKDTAESVLSRSRPRASRPGRHGATPRSYVSVVLSESEDAVAKAHDVFDSVQPPDRTRRRHPRSPRHLLDRSSDAVDASASPPGGAT